MQEEDDEDSIEVEEQQVLDDQDHHEDDYQSSYIMGRAIRDESSLGTGFFIENSDGGFRQIGQR